MARRSPARVLKAETKHSLSQIGQRLRALREARGLSLRALAARVGLTASLLSQIETGQANPSVETLFAVAEGLQVPVASFFPDADGPEEAVPARPFGPGPLVPRSQRARIQLDHGVVWESLAPVEQPGLEWMVIRYPPGAVSAETQQRHPGRDYGIVLRGQLTVRLAFREYRLGPGDAIAFEATTPHQLRNDGPTAVEAVWLRLDPETLCRQREAPRAP